MNLSAPLLEIHNHQKATSSWYCFTGLTVSWSPSSVHTYIPRLFRGPNTLHVYWSRQPRVFRRLPSPLLSYSVNVQDTILYAEFAYLKIPPHPQRANQLTWFRGYGTPRGWFIRFDAREYNGSADLNRDMLTGQQDPYLYFLQCISRQQWSSADPVCYPGLGTEHLSAFQTPQQWTQLRRHCRWRRVRGIIPFNVLWDATNRRQPFIYLSTCMRSY